MHATVRLRTKQLQKYRAMAGLNSDAALAARMGAHRSSIHRVLHGDGRFSVEFIGSLLRAFEHLDFFDLFEIVDTVPANGEPDTDAA